MLLPGYELIVVWMWIWSFTFIPPVRPDQ